MSRFASLGSGSRGNGTLVELGDQRILVDCGFTVKQAEVRLARLGLKAAELTAIVVTHEHADHIGGVGALAYKYGIPVYATFGTLEAGRSSAPVLGQAISAHAVFRLGNVEVQPVVVPHDAREPTQFVFRHDGLSIGVISDLGSVTPFVVQRFQELDGLFMESNYDEAMLLRGRYPERVKRRIAGDLGHLSNVQAADFLSAVAHPCLRVVIGHVSEENNHADLLTDTFAAHAERVSTLAFATQDNGMDWTEILADAAVVAGQVPGGA